MDHGGRIVSLPHDHREPRINRARHAEPITSHGGAFFGLGGSSVVVSWNAKGKLLMSPSKGSSLMGEESSVSHLTFEQWAEKAPWAARSGNASVLMEQLLQYVELEHPVPIKTCRSPFQADTLTEQDCLQALGGTTSPIPIADEHEAQQVHHSSVESSGAPSSFLGRTLGETVEKVISYRGSFVTTYTETNATTAADANAKPLVRREPPAASTASEVDTKQLVRREPKSAPPEIDATTNTDAKQLVRREPRSNETEVGPSMRASQEGGAATNTGVFIGLRKDPAFIVDVSVFSFDLDAFEIRLHELSNVVDLFALIETPVTHQGQPKPLVWARNKDKPRFRAFQDRVLHVVVEDKDLMGHLQSRSSKDSILHAGREKLQEMMQSLLSSRHLRGRSLVMNFGDADEIPSARNVALMKQCEPHQLPIDSGTWMPMGRFDRAIRSDRPVGGKGELPFTHGSPTFQEPSKIVEGGLGASGGYLLGGWHLTAYTYPPHALLKLLASEEKGIPEETVHMLEQGAIGVRQFFQQLSTLSSQSTWLHRSETLRKLRSGSPYREHPDLLQPPHVVQCNPDRFEVWYGHYDRRLDMALAHASDPSRSQTKHAARRSD